MTNELPLAVIGSGPAGLMCAAAAARNGARVVIFEKKKGPGRKLLIAGSSGLNISYDHPLESFDQFYTGPRERLKEILKAFPPTAWLLFLHDLGIGTFRGTSRRYFVEGLKASKLLRAWLTRLGQAGADIRYEHECVDFECFEREGQACVRLTFANGSTFEATGVCFALGGGSYEENEKPLRWPAFFEKKGLRFNEFEPSNVGYVVNWPEALLKEAEGQPLKNVTLTTARGFKQGELVITRYGLEGTPVYYMGTPGAAFVDLLPDMSLDQIRERLAKPLREKLSPVRQIKKQLSLSPAAQALLFHLTSSDDRATLERLSALLKALPLQLVEPRPLDEAISSRGGLDWDGVDQNLMLKRFPGVYVAGEMLDWDAPTGGFLIQMCVSQGFVAGQALTRPRSER